MTPSHEVRPEIIVGDERKIPGPTARYAHCPKLHETSSMARTKEDEGNRLASARNAARQDFRGIDRRKEPLKYFVGEQSPLRRQKDEIPAPLHQPNIDKLCGCRARVVDCFVTKFFGKAFQVNATHQPQSE